MKIFLLSMLAVWLTLLPLQNSLTNHFFNLQSGTLWNGNVLLTSFVLAVFYVYCLLKQPDYLKLYSVHRALIIVIILFALQLLSIHPHITEELIIVFLVIGSAPLVKYILHTCGIRLVVILFLSILSLHSFWAITQFVIQNDLGLYPLGETRLDSQAPGIAKFSPIISGSEKIIRAYGPYPHPNILAGSLLIGLITLSLYYRTFPRTFSYTIFTLLITGILVSFSRSALLATLLLTVVARVKHPFVPYSKFRKPGIPMIVILCLTIIVFIPFWTSRISDPQDNAAAERKSGLVWAYEIIKENQGQGVGIGHYRTALLAYLNEQQIVHQSWQIEPVHSAPILLLAEWGLLGAELTAIALIWFIYKIKWHTIWLMPLLPALLLDHYFLTQLSPLVWLTLLGLVLYSEAVPAQSPRSVLATQ